MAFMVSNAQPTFSDATQKGKLIHHEDRDDIEAHNNNVTSQLYLRSSSPSSPQSSSSQALDKEVVLRRIRHHKYLNKVRGAFQALKSSSRPANMAHEWLDQQGDAFSSP